MTTAIEKVAPGPSACPVPVDAGAGQSLFGAGARNRREPIVGLS